MSFPELLYKAQLANAVMKLLYWHGVLTPAGHDLKVTSCEIDTDQKTITAKYEFVEIPQICLEED